MLMYLIRIASHANFLFEYHGTRLWQSIETQPEGRVYSPLSPDQPIIDEGDLDDPQSSGEDDEDDFISGILNPQNEANEEGFDESRLHALLNFHLNVLVRSNDTIQDLLTISALSRNQAEADLELNPQIKELGNGMIEVDGFISPIHGLARCYFMTLQEAQKLLLEQLLNKLTLKLPTVQVLLDQIGAHQVSYQPTFHFPQHSDKATRYWRETLRCGALPSNIGFLCAIHCGALARDLKSLTSLDRAKDFLAKCDKLCDLLAGLIYLGDSGSNRGSE